MRDMLRAFAELMEAKLAEKDHRGEWPQSIPYHGFWMDRLHHEVDELVVALHAQDQEKISEEAADVANFAMFISDWYGLPLKEAADDAERS